jgi:hypothetical protein
MRDPKRIKLILNEIERIWSKTEDLRFFQLMIDLGVCPDSQFLWNLEDQDLLNHLNKIK